MSGHPNTEAIAKIAELQKEGNTRLVTIAAADEGTGNMELIYILDRKGELLTIRFRCRWEDELESLSPVFKGAENMEREIIDLLGARFEGVKGGLFLERNSGIVTPLRKNTQGA
jgi:NADH:ubiquinone oxidoreductase subunit C